MGFWYNGIGEAISREFGSGSSEGLGCDALGAGAEVEMGLFGTRGGGAKDPEEAKKEGGGDGEGEEEQPGGGGGLGGEAPLPLHAGFSPGVGGEDAGNRKNRMKD